MTGAFSAAVVQALASVSTTDGPPTVNQVVGLASPSETGPFAVPYTMQTGLTRYAPMQKAPGTRITARSAKPQYPTSSVTIATTWLPTPRQLTTVTEPQTKSVSSRENPANPAPKPSDDMSKYLNRWKD
ncbi:MAG: hypothetical protein M1829_001638 [Trizodia sp. TS-e1964]|nr:MAG: hypothetical protein M1829_001638 [Trizodia sp. TS-e1964]